MSKKTQVLDCTLRDGGYINDWNFGEQAIQSILEKLIEARIDIVECGYLNDNNDWNSAYSLYSTMERLAGILPKDRTQVQYAVMIDYGTFPASKLPEAKVAPVDYLRVCFSKADRFNALDYCREVMQKGYSVFVQPMNTITYSSEELLELLDEVNVLRPAAAYFVDSFGMMRREDVRRLYDAYNDRLSPDMIIGYHSHNNCQLAYSNALSLAEIQDDRSLIIDVSVFGMGRGAGNLNTELFVDYMNSRFETNYLIYPLLEIIDEELNTIYKRNYWGYSLPHYLSAINNCHPNYATYLSKKNTLTTKSIGSILKRIEEKDKNRFSEGLISKLYMEYQQHGIDDKQARAAFGRAIQGKLVLLLAPGHSLASHQERIRRYIQDKKPFVIGVNSVFEGFPLDMVFVSNRKRWKKVMDILTEGDLSLMVTSNLRKELGKVSADYVVDYAGLLNEDPYVGDNAGLMLLALLKECAVGPLILAGFDGYSPDGENYANTRLEIADDTEMILRRNQSMKKYMRQYAEITRISFLTPSQYKDGVNTPAEDEMG